MNIPMKMPPFRSIARVSGFLGLGWLAACAAESSTSSSSVSAIDLSPSPCTVTRGGSRKLSAEATLPNGTKKDVSSDSALSWTTDNKDTATVDAGGMVVGVSAGATKITATYQGATGTIVCTVTP